jgi:transposase
MRKGLDGLATLIQEHLKKDPVSGHLFVFRGKNASLLKILFWDGTGLCLFTKRMDHGSFCVRAWQSLDGDTDASAARHVARASTGVHLNTSGGRFWPGDNKLKNRLSAGKLLGPIRVLT